MDSGDSNIILPFDFVRSEQFEIHLDTQDLKASIRFCNGKTLLDGKAFAKGAMADLKDGQKIEIEDIKFKVITTSAPAATDSNSGPKKDVSAEQQGSKLKGETMVNIRTLGTLTSPKKDAMFNALPSQAIQQDSERVAKRPSPTMPVAHAETTAFLESISKQPTYSPLKPITLTPQKRLDSPTDGGSSTVLECLPKLEDYRRGGFVGKGSHGQVFKHQSRHSQEVFAVKVIIFPKVRPAGRGDTEAEMVAAFVRQMAYIQREADILLKTNHVSSREVVKSMLANLLSSDSYFERTKSFAIQKD